MINKPRNNDNAEAENLEWKKFKGESEERINQNEKMVDEFKQQAKRINKNLKKAFNKKVSDFEQKNIALKQKMKDYTEDRTDEQEKFKDEFSRSLNELSE